jgi:NTP pyrophosphatase (non-canonical NTP hydrolase)
MNTENFKPIKGIDLNFIQDRQMEVMFKYEPQEKEVFEVFKRYAWRVTEEIVEALEDIEHPKHLKEELTDAFNFLIELYHLYGWRLEQLSPLEIPKMNLGEDQEIDFEIYAMKVIKQLGLTCNLLKNRPWRQSQYLVDLLVFEQRFKEVWPNFLLFLGVCGMTKEELFDQWSLKYQVNKFRIESMY